MYCFRKRQKTAPMLVAAKKSDPKDPGSISEALVLLSDRCLRGECDYKSQIPEHLVKTNDEPNPAEEQFLRGNRTALKLELITDLGAVNEDIEHAKLVLQRLEQRKNVITTSQTALDGILSAVRRIPDELLIEIFRFAAEDEPVTLDTNRGIWKYGQVCRRWRSLLTRCNDLWSFVRISDSDRDPDTIPNVSDLCRILFCGWNNRRPRTRKDLVDMTIDLYHPSRSFLNEILRYSRHWKTLSVVVNAQVLDSFRGISLPELESIKFRTQGAIHDNTLCASELKNWFQYSPKLKKACFGGFVELENPKFGFPWRQITHFTDETNGGHSLDLLNKMPNLVEYSARGVRPPRHLPQPGYGLDSDDELVQEARRTRHNKLQVVRLEGKGAAKMLNYLTLPALKAIHMLHLEEMTPLESLIARSKCNLESITLASSFRCGAPQPTVPSYWSGSGSSRQKGYNPFMFAPRITNFFKDTCGTVDTLEVHDFQDRDLWRLFNANRATFFPELRTLRLSYRFLWQNLASGMTDVTDQVLEFVKYKLERGHIERVLFVDRTDGVEVQEKLELYRSLRGANGKQLKEVMVLGESTF